MPPRVPVFYPSVGRGPSPNGCFETVEGDDPIYERASSPRVGRVVPLSPGRGGVPSLKAVLFSSSLRGGSSARRTQGDRSSFHLMEQPADPTVGYRGGDHAGRLARRTQRRRQGTPAGVEADQPMGRLDERGSEQFAAGLDQPGVGLPLAAGGVARRQPAVSRQLLAAVEAIEPADLGPQCPGRHWAHAPQRHQLGHDRVVGGHLSESGLDPKDRLVEPPQISKVVIDDPAGLRPQVLGGCQPGQPRAAPAPRGWPLDPGLAQQAP